MANELLSNLAGGQRYLYSYRAVLGEYAVEIYSDQKKPISWCDEFLGPYFGNWAAPGRTILTLYCNYRTPCTCNLPVPEEPVPLFFGRRGKRMQTANGNELILDGSDFYLKAQDRVAIWFNSNDPVRYQIPSRIAREALVAEFVAAGAVRIHGGVGFLPKRSLLVFGPSGCGKTAVIFHLLRSGAHFLCCNDRVVVRASGRGLLGYGLPIYSKIGEEIVGWFPALGPLIADSQLLAERLVQPSYRSGQFLKYALSPQHISERLGLRISPLTRLQGVIVPDLRSARGISCEVVSVADGQRRELLRESLLEPDPAFPTTFYKPLRKPERSNTARELLELPWARVRGNYRDKSLVSRLGEFFTGSSK